MRGDARCRYEGYRRGMSFRMAPAFFSTDMERTRKFWGALGFDARVYDDDFMILEHPTGFVLHFGLDLDLVPSENMTNAYLRFTTSDEAVALYDEWVGRVSDDGFIHAPGTTFYGMIEWGMTDPDANALRVGGPADPT
jgi:hypothetical protein